MQNTIKFFIILLLVFILGVFFISLNKSSNYDTKYLLGNKLTNFQLKSFYDNKVFINNDFKENNFTLINFWASWCAPCRVEHPQLERLSELENVELYGVNYKDKKNSALNFLKEYGNPFLKIGTDQSGRNAIEWGVYGVPETFVIDQEGRVLFRHAGPITKEIMKTKFYKFINQ